MVFNLEEGSIIGIITLVVTICLWLIDRTTKNKKIRAQGEDLHEQQLKNKETQQQLKAAKRAVPDNIEIMANVDDVLGNSATAIIREKIAREGPDITIKIYNFGLDLQSVMSWVTNTFVHETEFDEIQFEIKSLIINPESSFLKDIIDGESNITTNTVNTSIANAKKLQSYKNLKKFDFKIRQYDNFPIYHGFIINDEHLFVSFTYFNEGKLIGRNQPYLHVTSEGENPSKLTKHYFRFFKDWFNHYWKISTEVVHINK
ncbi:MAG: hypothetical protein EOP46_15195 [Sphingobacteriaceae bacterium]|nr:MAG: hypothetical protein EOP46_15195 [Sphingobacteriaceae bacterium]